VPRHALGQTLKKQDHARFAKGKPWFAHQARLVGSIAAGPHVFSSLKRKELSFHGIVSPLKLIFPFSATSAMKTFCRGRLTF
jgi:hypothetical protein